MVPKKPPIASLAELSSPAGPRFPDLLVPQQAANSQLEDAATVVPDGVSEMRVNGPMVAPRNDSIKGSQKE